MRCARGGRGEAWSGWTTALIEVLGAYATCVATGNARKWRVRAASQPLPSDGNAVATPIVVSVHSGAQRVAGLRPSLGAPGWLWQHHAPAGSIA